MSQCISLPHSRETEGEGTERSSFLKLVGDYWIWYLRQQEAGLFSTMFLNFCGLAVLTRGSVSYFNHDTVLATREDSPAHVLRSACVSSCWEKLYISCTFNVMGNWPQWYQSDSHQGMPTFKRESPMLDATWGIYGVHMPVSHPAGHLNQDTVLQFDITLLLAHPTQTSPSFPFHSSMLVDATWPISQDLTQQDILNDTTMSK